MKWNTGGRITIDEMRDLQLKEVEAVKNSIGVVAMYKAAGQRQEAQVDGQRNRSGSAVRGQARSCPWSG